ncbi:protein with 2 TPR domains [Cryptosporidium ryanae]|uniref:protein with 2 TPR domains n=1 Tax=Cryptosporidium ryanae TaxID=515981 RepID=UPI00351A40B9|nr:protein with 2 TPR domains [Cryptosporidium ryanae]
MLKSAEFYTDLLQGKDVKLSAIREDETILTEQARILKNEFDSRKKEIDKIVNDFCDERTAKIYERIGSMITTQRRLWNALIKNSGIDKAGSLGEEITKGEVNELVLNELEEIERNCIENEEYINKIEEDWENIRKASKEGIKISEEIDWNKIPEEELGKRLRGGEVLHRDEWIPDKNNGRKLSETELKSHMSFGEMIMEEGKKAYQSGDLELAYTRYTQGVELLSWVRGGDIDSENGRIDMYKRFLKNQSLLALKLGKYNDSIVSCNKVLQIDECDEKSLYRRGECYMMLGRYEEAKKDFRFICEFDYFSKEAKIQSRRKLVDMMKKSRLNNNLGRNIISKIEGIMLDNRKEADTKAQISLGNMKLNDSSSTCKPRSNDKEIEISRKEKNPHLDLETTKDILEDLMFAYSSKEFEEELFRMRRLSDYDEKRLIRRVRKVLPNINEPIYEKYGLKPNEVGYERARKKVEESVAYWRQRNKDVSELSKEIYKYIMGDTLIE